MADAQAILNEVLSGYADADKWVGASFEGIKRLSNTKVGDVGQDFVERLCKDIGYEVEFPLNSEGKRTRNSPWDIRIEGIMFELKTATEDVNGSFQFNHIRYHREYQALLCVGIAPEDIRFDAWSKATVSTGGAGTLVSMEKGGSVSWKLSKPSDQLRSISEFDAHILNVLTEV